MNQIQSDVVVSGVTKFFRGQNALAGVDLEAGPGITGLLGPNGAGKTTLLRIIATVLRADAGHVCIFGRDPFRAADRHSIRSRLGYQPQEPGFFTGFTVTAFLDYVAILKEITDRRERHADVRRVIDLLGLRDVAGRKIRRLSGGMRRRVAIAQAMLGRPQLLIFDEPTAGLDPAQRLRFREIVSQVAAERTVLLSTHQTDDVAALCDRVIVLHSGRRRFIGTPNELAAHGSGHVWLAEQPGSSATISWRTGTGEYRAIGARPEGGRPAVPTLEDGYLMLVGTGPQRFKESA